MKGRAYIFTSTANGKGSMIGGVSGRAATFGMTKGSGRDTVPTAIGEGAIRNDVATGSGHQIRTSSGNTIASLNNDMKVTVMVTQMATDKRLLVTQNDHIVRTASGNIVRLPNN